MPLDCSVRRSHMVGMDVQNEPLRALLNREEVLDQSSTNARHDSSTVAGGCASEECQERLARRRAFGAPRYGQDDGGGLCWVMSDEIGPKNTHNVLAESITVVSSVPV